MEVKFSNFFIVMIIGAFMGLPFGVLIGMRIAQDSVYKDGQLDCQRGVIRYELTDNGYIEHVELD